MAATTETQQKATQQTGKSSDENVFSAWRGKKDGTNPPVLNSAATAAARRMSTMKTLNVGQSKGIAGLRRMTLTMRAKSDVSAEQLNPTVKKENTYKMKPDDGTQFSVAKVTRAVKQMLEDELDGYVYDYDNSSKVACELAEKVKERVKELGFPRYKIAANVMMGQAGDQGLEVASRCCWDHVTDNYACVTHKTKSLFVIALVYGVYYE